MRLKKYLQEETITTDVETGADAATSNKLLSIKTTDKTIKKILSDLKKKGAKTTKQKDGTVLLDIPFETPKSVMTKLSKYTV